MPKVGYKQIPEHTRKIGKANKGKHYFWKDKILSEEHKKRISESLKGRLLSESHRKNLSEAKRREKCYLWKGGISLLAELIRKGFKYRQWRSDVFTRDNFICQECGARSGNGKAVYLEAHHIKEFSKIMEEYKIKTLEEALNCEELWNINNGRTLCSNCHQKTDNYGNKKNKNS